MESFWENFENYEKNLMCLRDLTDRLLSHMKGHDISFRPEITDEKGYFSQEKLLGLVEKLLSLWAAKQREGTFTDPSTGKSLAEPYIQDRQELYSSYLYLVLRCSLCQGDYTLVEGSEMKERTDFAFVLEQARRLIRSWCVMEGPDGSRRNELFWGYDTQFGLHLYRVLSCPAAGFDMRLDFGRVLPVDRPDLVTEGGRVNRNLFNKIYIKGMPASLAKKVALAQLEEGITGGGRGEDSCEGGDGYGIEDSCEEEDDYGIEDDCEGGDDCDDYESAFATDDYWEYPEGYDFEAEYEARQQWAQKQCDLEYLAQFFKCQDEYVAACERFVALFQQAKQEVLWRFCEDLEEIVALYLVERGIPPLMDTDKTLNVYGGIFDGPYRQAERYAKGAEWKNL